VSRAPGNTACGFRFDDGVEGETDVASMLSFKGVFAPLRDPNVFDGVKVDPVLGTIVRGPRPRCALRDRDR
jgi:hypothetical protein